MYNLKNYQDYLNNKVASIPIKDRLKIMEKNKQERDSQNKLESLDMQRPLPRSNSFKLPQRMSVVGQMPKKGMSRESVENM